MLHYEPLHVTQKVGLYYFLFEDFNAWLADAELKGHLVFLGYPCGLLAVFEPACDFDSVFDFGLERSVYPLRNPASDGSLVPVAVVDLSV